MVTCHLLHVYVHVMSCYDVIFIRYDIKILCCSIPNIIVYNKCFFVSVFQRFEFCIGFVVKHVK